MRHFFRAAAILGAGILLLAAGEAPNGELGFLADIETPAAEIETVPPVDFIEQTPEFAEPELGPMLPEAGSLAEMVRGVRDLDDVKLDDEMRCLATAVYFESKGEPLDGQLAVAQVILNRVEDGRFGRDICSVVKAPKQFSFVRGGALPAPRGTEQWETAKAIALIAVGGGWTEIVPDATHFHATRVNPGWKMRRVATVGQHVFYR